MNYRHIESCNLSLPELSLGGAYLGTPRDGEPSDDLAIETVHFALNNGFTLIDTSPLYGESERRIGLALDAWYQQGGSRQDLLLSSKTGTRNRAYDYSRDATLRSVELSLQELKTDYLDILHIHDPLSVEHVLEAIPTVVELKEQGVIKAIGIGCRNFDFHNALFESGHSDLHLTYLEYNLLSQNALPLMKKTQEQGKGILNATTFYHGLLAGPDPTTIEPQYQVPNDPVEKAYALWQFAEEKDVSLMHLNIQWILRNPAITSILFGASTAEHLQTDLDALTPIDESIFLELHDRFGL